MNPKEPAAACARYIDPISRTAYIAAMALRDILILPDKRLRLVSEPVKKIDHDVRALVDDMMESLLCPRERANGSGLVGPAAWPR